MNYKINFDRSMTNITKTHDSSDGETVFKTLPAAKKVAIAYLREEIDGLKESLNLIKDLENEHIEGESEY